MNKRVVKTKELYDCQIDYLKPYFEAAEYPWELLPKIKEILAELLKNPPKGYTFYKDAKLRRLTRYRYNNLPLDQDGFHIYIKDKNTIWNPGWQPTRTKLDHYECRHGLGYSVITGSKNKVEARQELYVPKNDNILLMRVTLTNKDQKEKELDLFSFVEFCLWDAQDDTTNFQRNYSTGEVEVEGSAIYHKTEFRERRNHYAVFFANREISSFDTSCLVYFLLYVLYSAQYYHKY